MSGHLFFFLLYFLCLAVLVTSQGDCSESSIKVQLSRTTQARFAGYYVALAKGMYSEECVRPFLDTNENVDPVNEILAKSSVVFGSYWTQQYLQAIGNDSNPDLDIIHIAQLQYKSGFFLASLASSSSNTFTKKRISLWPNYDAEVIYMLKRNYGVSRADFYPVPQSSTVLKLYDGDVDFVSCNKFDEYAQLLRVVKNQKTLELWQPADLIITDPDTRILQFVGMLKDGIMVKRSWLYGSASAWEITVNFVKATLKGWIFCRDHFDECIELLNSTDVDLAIWQLNEILDMTFTGFDKFGSMNESKLNTTITGLDFIGLTPKPINVTHHFDFKVIEDVYASLLITDPELNLTAPYKKLDLKWCLDKSYRTVLCYRMPPPTTSESASSKTGMIIGLVVGLSGGVLLFAFIFLFMAIGILCFLNRKTKRMKVPSFKDIEAVQLKDSSTKAEFRSLLKNYDFVSILSKKSANDPSYSKDVRRALVYFHVNNGTLVDMFDFFLVKELESHKSKSNKIQTPEVSRKPSVIVESSDSSATQSSSDTDTDIPSPKRKTSNQQKSLNGKLMGLDSETTLFRLDSFVTDIFRYYSQLVGLYYLWYILSYPVRKLDKFGKKQTKARGKKQKKHPSEVQLSMQVFGLSVEVDPNKVSLGDVTINKLQLQVLAQQIFVSITRSADTFPELLRDLLKKMEDRVLEYGGDGALLKALSNFVFLRYICAALISPQEYGLLDAAPGDEMQRIMILLSKIFQNLANGTMFEKEEYMMEMNDFIKTNLQPMEKFLMDILKSGEKQDPTPDMDVPFNVEEAGVSVLYHFCSENRGKISKLLAELSAETGWLFDEIFPEDSSEDSEVEKYEKV